MEPRDANVYRELPYSNDPAGKADAAFAYAQIDGLQAKLRRIDIELTLLLANRARTVCHIARCKTVVAPHKKLPTELISEIISAYVQASQTIPLPLKKGKDDIRLHITQVCSSWRRIAFDIPTLWDISFLCVDPPESSVKLATAWFHQYTGPPLALEIGGISMSSTSVSLSRETFILTELVIPYAARFRTLDLDVGIPTWDAIKSLPFEALVTLYLRPKLISGTIRPGGLVTTPLLRSVYAQGNGFGVDTMESIPKLPWAQLTALSVSGDFDPGSVFKTLSQCSSLESCEVYHLSPSSTTPLPNASISMPHLKSLSMGFITTNLLDLLFLMRLPSLSFLKIDTLPRTEVSIFKFTTFVSSICNTLRHFEVARAGWHGSLHEDYIFPMRSLTNFILPYGHFFTSEILVKIGTGELLPRIQHLGFPVRHDEENVVDMLVARHAHDARANGVRKLREVDILSQGIRWRSPEISRLQQLRTQGIDLKLHHTRR